ncbi:hypothetical protein Tco_0010606, partial [Tanacetum coccineum]
DGIDGFKATTIDTDNKLDVTSYKVEVMNLEVKNISEEASDGYNATC